MFIGYAEILDICSTVLIVQVSGCQTLEKSLLIQEMGATNPEKVKMVVKNMETFMPKVMMLISECPDVFDDDDGHIKKLHGNI